MNVFSNPNVYWRITTDQVVHATNSCEHKQAIRTRNILTMHAAQVRARAHASKPVTIIYKFEHAS